jgi:hypothetical protein
MKDGRPQAAVANGSGANAARRIARSTEDTHSKGGRPTWRTGPNPIFQRQFPAAKTRGWLPHFQKAAKDYEFPPELLLGIASRETNMKNIVGDGGHGYGVMQIDDRSYPDWCSDGWKDVDACIQKGALVLDGKREQIRSGEGKSLKIGGATFRGAPSVSDTDLIRVSVAAYNSGLWAFYCFSKGRDPDAKSTGHDYSKDVLNRTQLFATFLSG